jgi:hypothetical protein
MQDMEPIRRGDGSQHLHRQSPDYRQHIRRKMAAYERHIRLDLMAQGLLQYLALTFRCGGWLNFHSYIRTGSPKKPPSEWVVTHAPRHGWPHFFAGSPESLTLKKFLASKISLTAVAMPIFSDWKWPHERTTLQYPRRRHSKHPNRHQAFQAVAALAPDICVGPLRDFHFFIHRHRWWVASTWRKSRCPFSEGFASSGLHRRSGVLAGSAKRCVAI